MKESGKGRGKDWFEAVLDIRTPLSPTVAHFYVPLFNTVAKKTFLR
jgi:hypothetical protein